MLTTVFPTESPTEVIPWLWVQVGAVVGWLSAIGLVAIALSYQIHVEPELVRKVVHIGTGNIIVLAWWLQVPAWLGIGAAIVFSLLAFFSSRYPLLPGLDTIGRKSLGTVFYAISIGVLIAGFWRSAPHFAVLGVLVMTWGDGLAGLCGKWFGQHQYTVWGMQKSWEGSLTMAIVSGLVSGLVLWGTMGHGWQIWVSAIAIGLIAMGLETVSKWGLDNLTVPIGSAVIAWLLSYLL
ncbi:SEC59/DGK1/VTE5 family protein [Trichothermofontia sichuanensis B231]|uniref:diacylglycerol/polyprenol kinase family protein n=1 Tax=Trichothermofontia sichuanensis TaxID=3045816 RepID=UPI0022467855|nr:diacylglycerol/polyprenol kinase family protein [Trichothermofontia sichuanensis]UZQ55408.1 SEC59/DGK1/VTE5 family protein [Trichothermofontia sichuanensis B231]